MALTLGVRVTSLAPFGHQCGPTGKKRGGIKRLSIPVMYLIYSLSFHTGLNLSTRGRVQELSFILLFFAKMYFFFKVYLLYCFLTTSGLSFGVWVPEPVGSVVKARGLSCPSACGILVL